MNTIPSFSASPRFEGRRPGCIFKNGQQGLGYYQESGGDSYGGRDGFPSNSSFSASPFFEGRRPGCIFKNGQQGLGYYQESGHGSRDSDSIWGFNMSALFNASVLPDALPKGVSAKMDAAFKVYKDTGFISTVLYRDNLEGEIEQTAEEIAKGMKHEKAHLMDLEEKAEAMMMSGKDYTLEDFLKIKKGNINGRDNWVPKTEVRNRINDREFVKSLSKAFLNGEELQLDGHPLVKAKRQLDFCLKNPDEPGSKETIARLSCVFDSKTGEKLVDFRKKEFRDLKSTPAEKEAMIARRKVVEERRAENKADEKKKATEIKAQQQQEQQLREQQRERQQREQQQQQQRERQQREQQQQQQQQREQQQQQRERQQREQQQQQQRERQQREQQQRASTSFLNNFLSSSTSYYPTHSSTYHHGGGMSSFHGGMSSPSYSSGMGIGNGMASGIYRSSGSANGQQMFTGSRGGQYYVTGGGNRRYV